MLPAVGEVLWGRVELFTVPDETRTFCVRRGGALYVFDFDGGRVTPVTVIESSKTAPLGSPVSSYTFPPPTPPVCDRRVLVP